MGRRARMLDRAKATASAAEGKKLATVEIGVLECGLMPFIPTRARMAALVKPRPATGKSPTAGIVRLMPPRSCR